MVWSLAALTRGNSWETCQVGGRRAPKPKAGKSLSLEKKSRQVNLKSPSSISNIQIQPSLKAELAFLFHAFTHAQHLALVKTRTQVIQLGAQCIDHWTTGRSCGLGMPAVQLTTHVKSSTLCGCTVVWSYGRTVVHPIVLLDGLLLFCIIMGLHSECSSTCTVKKKFSK